MPEQLFLHGQGEENGDCYRASLAHLLGLATEAVPHFLSKANEGDWPENAEAWLREHFGLKVLTLAIRPEHVGQYKEALEGVPHLMSGISPRFSDSFHCVYAVGMEVLFDPHPDKTGILPVEAEYQWEIELFLKLSYED